ncbi:capsule assembly Wzi family protein [Daejeonella sp.]|uniref:capsule assembly Wzi family protein n=1 Tax=Daejeonella sp. TaxID=2805397 RepID=UPI00272F15FE|nr:capsule assembly Wzi family protein [Daejeonella sp.]MDP2414312.1 capsule assembly Wzi family protein [Daejeonella sp.]
MNLEFVFAQSLPLGSVVLEDYYLRKQLNGELDSTISFTVRPSFPFLIETKNRRAVDTLLDSGKQIYGSASGKSKILILPFSWQQRYNGHPSYSRNDGAMIPAKGYQSLVSVGFFAKAGPISVQIRPEYVFAGNGTFREYRSHLGSADLPVRFGKDPYSRLSWGQSSVRLNFDPVSIGLSNENLWWGPGKQNSILMSNTAPGFKHLTLNTSRPVRTPIGSIEAQIIAGRLEGSGYTDGLSDDWRYLSGLVLSYQPRWVPGLFLGLTRSFQTYSEDMDDSFGDYLPFFQAFQKINTKEDAKRRDQLTAVFARWLLTKSRAEVYFEYGLNDHSYNTRDFLMSPEHSRAYTLGISKLIPYKGRKDEYIHLGIELTHMEQSIDRILRDAGEWYTHSQVLHGYTNRGEVLGAGIGPGGNFQSVNISWVKGLKQIGLQFERYEHNGDLASASGYGPWIDFSAAAVGNWDYKKFIFNAKLQAIESVNYQWLSGPFGSANKNAFHVNGEVGVMYRF